MIVSYQQKRLEHLQPVSTGDVIVEKPSVDDLLAESTTRVWISPDVDSFHWVFITPEQRPSYYSGTALTQEQANDALRNTAVYHLSKPT